MTTITSTVRAALADAYAQAEEAEEVSDPWIGELRRTPPADPE